jgi:hypothetical protein
MASQNRTYNAKDEGAAAENGDEAAALEVRGRGGFGGDHRLRRELAFQAAHHPRAEADVSADQQPNGAASSHDSPEGTSAGEAQEQKPRCDQQDREGERHEPKAHDFF